MDVRRLLDLILWWMAKVILFIGGLQISALPRGRGRLSSAEGGVALALALALRPELATHTAKTVAAFGVGELGVRPAEFSPF